MILKKILILRFSSIGDIVLTTPIIRCLKNQLPNSEIHFVCKKKFSEVLIHNPYLTTLHTFENEIEEIEAQLKQEQFDLVIDLHYNLRSFRLKRKLGVKSFHFNKINFRKFLAVSFKMKNKLPRGHIVDRYFEPLKSIGITNDGKGLDFFISSTDEVNISNLISTEDKKFIALVVGGSYYTKQIPLNKLNEICLNSSLPLILLGSQQDSKIAEALCSQNKNAINVCGKFSLLQTASILKQAEWVITPDTGLMHIASAYCKKIISMWGNTVPEFGMSAYNPNSENIILENKNLSCRPCSKLGYHQCPLRHFDCMNKLDVEFVKDLK